MERLITIINPIGGNYTHHREKTKQSTKGEKMAARRKKRSKKRSTKRKSYKKRAKRRNPVSRKRTYKKRTKRRSYKKVARRRRRNPKFKMPKMKGMFTQSRLINAFALLAGIGGSAILKQMSMGMIVNPMFSRIYGLLSIVAGATINMQGKRKVTKSVGTGMVVYGLFDLLVTNIPQAAQYLPGITGPTAFMGNLDYGRSVMGANIGAGENTNVVGMGANIDSNIPSEIVGDYDIDDFIDMY